MDNSIKTGPVTGTIISLMGSISWIDIERTLVLGPLGAAISFLVSYYLKKVVERKKRVDDG